LYWDGRRDSQWSQALSPLEDANEHGTDRRHVVRVIAEDPAYSETYKELFGDSLEQANEEAVNTSFSNIGKAIAAFERLLLPAPSRFDDYVAAVITNDVAEQQKLFTDDEIVGLQLFIGKANCTQCHNGPLLTNHEFHNTGVISFPGEVPDKGRVLGVREVQDNVFNCDGPYSDDRDRNCAELEYARTGPELIGAFRTPSLRNLENTAPFMHKGQIATLFKVLRQMEAFLRTLSAPLPSDQLIRP
jgi:cytochrome c peroxidase